MAPPDPQQLAGSPASHSVCRRSVWLVLIGWLSVMDVSLWWGEGVLPVWVRLRRDAAVRLLPAVARWSGCSRGALQWRGTSSRRDASAGRVAAWTQ